MKTLALAIVLAAAPALATTYQVGATRTYTSPCKLAAAVTLAPGDEIDVDPGTYTDACQLTASGTQGNPITMRGVAGMPRPVFDAAGIDLSGAGSVPRAIFQFTNASYWVVEHLELEHAANFSLNGAGFRVTAGGHDITLRDMSIHNNQDGGMSDGPSVIVIENSDIYANGANDGQSHNLYLQGDVVELVGNHIHDSTGGQNVKLRTRYVELVANLIEHAGNYEIDLIQGPYTSMANANAVLIGNVIVRAANAGNNTQAILFGTDNVNDTTPSRNGAFYAIANTFVMANASDHLIHVQTSAPAPAATAVFLYDNIVHTTVANNQLTFDATTQGYVSGSNNFITDGIGGVPATVTATIGGTDPGFVDITTGDYHLASGSPAIDVGAPAPTYVDGTGATLSGVPALEPVLPIGSEPRYVVGATIDDGAFEFGNTPPVTGDVVGDDAGIPPPGGPPPAKSGGCCDASSGAPTGWMVCALLAAKNLRRRRRAARGRA